MNYTTLQLKKNEGGETFFVSLHYIHMYEYPLYKKVIKEIKQYLQIDMSINLKEIRYNIKIIVRTK